MKKFLRDRNIKSSIQTHTCLHIHTLTDIHRDSDFSRLNNSQELIDLESLELIIIFTHYKTKQFSLHNWNFKGKKRDNITISQRPGEIIKKKKSLLFEISHLKKKDISQTVF